MSYNTWNLGLVRSGGVQSRRVKLIESSVGNRELLYPMVLGLRLSGSAKLDRRRVGVAFNLNSGTVNAPADLAHLDLNGCFTRSGLVSRWTASSFGWSAQFTLSLNAGPVVLASPHRSRIIKLLDIGTR